MDFLLLFAHHGLPASIDQACSSVGFSPRPRRRAHVAPDPPSALRCYSAKPGLPPTPAQLYNLCRLMSTKMTRTTRTGWAESGVFCDQTPIKTDYKLPMSIPGYHRHRAYIAPELKNWMEQRTALKSLRY